MRQHSNLTDSQAVYNYLCTVDSVNTEIAQQNIIDDVLRLCRNNHPNYFALAFWAGKNALSDMITTILRNISTDSANLTEFKIEVLVAFIIGIECSDITNDSIIESNQRALAEIYHLAIRRINNTDDQDYYAEIANAYSVIHDILRSDNDNIFNKLPLSILTNDTKQRILIKYHDLKTEAHETADVHAAAHEEREHVIGAGIRFLSTRTAQSNSGSENAGNAGNAGNAANTSNRNNFSNNSHR